MLLLLLYCTKKRTGISLVVGAPWSSIGKNAEVLSRTFGNLTTKTTKVRQNGPTINICFPTKITLS